MKNHYTYRINLAIALLLVFATSFAQKAEKTKSESFEVDQNTLLDISSKFGEVEITTEDGSMLSVEANIWVESNRQSEADELLEQLDAEIYKDGNTVVVKSVLPDRLSTRNKTKFRVDFTITAPEYINLNLSSKYGSVYVEETSGKAEIYVGYGNLKVLELNRGNQKPLNKVTLAYSKGNIEEAGWLKVDLAYSKLAIEEAAAVVSITKYSGLSIEECSSLVMESKYDTYSIGELNNFLGELKYGNLSIDELSSKLDVESAYSSVKVDEIGSDFESIRVENSRGGYKLGISEGASFTINGVAIRGDISVYGMENLSKKSENADKYIKGTHGNNPKSTIELEVKEGNIKIELD